MTRNALALIVLLSAASASAEVRSLGQISFVVPDGWKFDQKGDAAAMATTIGDGYLILLVAKLRPASADADADHRSAWTETVTANFQDPVPPYSIYDHKGKAGYGGKWTGSRANPARCIDLYTFRTDKGVVPVVAMASSQQLLEGNRRLIGQFVQGVRVAPAKAEAPKANVTVADLVGDWRTGAASSTTYVDRSTGQYAGSNTVAYGAFYSIAPNGSYTYSFQGITNGRVITEKKKGAVQFTPELIVFRDGDGRAQSYRMVSCQTTTTGGTLLTLLAEQYPVTDSNISMYAEEWLREPPKK